ncbi:MAG TPA: MotA/TolQ/ExbB proton channel family protein [Anaeromyxobacter sp.]
MLTRKFLDLTATFGADWVNWVLVAVSLTATTILIDRLLLYVRTRERYPRLRTAFAASLRDGEISGALAAVEGDSLVRNVLRAGLRLAARGERAPASIEQMMLGQLAEERARYEARLAVLTTIGNISPLIGLLGTVIGIVGAFYVLGRLGTAQAAGNPAIMASIGEALVTTGFSIAVAVPAVIAYNALRAHVAARTKHAEALMRELVANLPNLRNDGASGE